MVVGHLMVEKMFQKKGSFRVIGTFVPTLSKHFISKAAQSVDACGESVPFPFFFPLDVCFGLEFPSDVLELLSVSCSECYKSLGGRQKRESLQKRMKLPRDCPY